MVRLEALWVSNFQINLQLEKEETREHETNPYWLVSWFLLEVQP